MSSFLRSRVGLVLVASLAIAGFFVVVEPTRTTASGKPSRTGKESDTLRVKVDNRLPEGTTVHWHGLPIVNDMDGVPDVTQPPIRSGEQFVYEFAVPVAGTYMYHSHSGLQLDRALHDPLIVEPKKRRPLVR